MTQHMFYFHIHSVSFYKISLQLLSVVLWLIRLFLLISLFKYSISLLIYFFLPVFTLITEECILIISKNDCFFQFFQF